MKSQGAALLGLILSSLAAGACIIDNGNASLTIANQQLRHRGDQHQPGRVPDLGS